MTVAYHWLIPRSFTGWRLADLTPDCVAGLTLAAIAIPEQMATARLGGMQPGLGLLALVAGSIGFALFGANRLMSVGADSTITPIFAGALALLAASGSPDYLADAAELALSVGVILVLAGIFRLAFIADLLSIPVTTGFLAGIAVHILSSQLPALMGVDAPPGPTLPKLFALATEVGAANPLTLALGLGVLAAMIAGEKLNPRFPSALVALSLATLATWVFALERHGVSTLGMLASVAPRLVLPSIDSFFRIAPLAGIVAVVVMVQTAATTRGFVSDPVEGPQVNRDFIGVGAANLVAGLIGAFPVNASPPRTAVIAETGGVSQLAGLVAAALALALSIWGGALLAHAPHAALAGVLLFVALRIVRVGVMRDVFQRSLPEFALILATIAAIVVLPIEQGVGVGIALSILHGVWTTTRARLVEFELIPGTSIWWPHVGGDTIPGVRVVGLQAPLSFLNAYQFQRELGRFSDAKLLVIEADAIVEIDYTGATTLADAIRRLRASGVEVAFARLESVRAQESFARHGLEELIGRDHLFHSVAEAVRALGPDAKA